MTSAAGAISILAVAGPAADLHAIPIQLAFEQPAGHLGLESPQIELDLGSASVADIGEDPVDGRFDSLLDDAPDAAASRQRLGARPPVDSASAEPGPVGSPRAPSSRASGPFLSALARHQLELGRLQALQGDLEGAVANLERGLEIDPEHAETRAELGTALIRLGRFAEGERQLLRAIELGGASAQVYAALARATEAQGRPADAIRHGRQALQLDPDLVFAANNLAWILATCSDPKLRDPDEAIRLARGALRLVPGEPPSMLDTLAAAYAAAGRYGEAVATARRAEALAREQGQHQLAREIRERLERYRASQPFVES